MPDDADHSSSSTFRGAAIGRRGLLRLGVTAVMLASCRRLGVMESPNSAQIANLGSVIELSADANGALSLTSLKNTATGFEWLRPAQGFAPTFVSSSGTSAAWQPLPAKATQGNVTIRSATAGTVEGQLNLVAYADTGAFRWQQTFLNTGADPVREVTRMDRK